MGLSERATKFLQKSQREYWPVTEQNIRDAFTGNNAPLYQPLIDLQLNYGGYMFYKGGSVPVKFTLLHGEGGYPQTTGTSIIEFSYSRLDSPKYFFACVSIEHMQSFVLDEQGVYYEDHEPLASSFEKHIEHLALWDEVKDKGFITICRDRELATKELDKLLGLQLIPEASDEFILWFCNDYIYLQYWQGLATLIVHNSYPDIMALRSL